MTKNLDHEHVTYMTLSKIHFYSLRDKGALHTTINYMPKLIVNVSYCITVEVGRPIVIVGE